MTTTITARVDSEKKRQAEEIFNDIGMTLSGAINVFINEVVMYHGILFNIEGSTTVELDSFSSENVTFEAGEPVSGKVRLTAKPNPKTPASTFFMRVKLK